MEQTDSELARAYVEATGSLSQEEAAGAVGVSQSTLSNWRQGRLPTKLRPAWRRAIARHLAGREEPTGETAPYNEEREEGELARIGAIPDPLLRTMERESIAAVIRAQSMRDACRAARIEAEKAPDRSSVKAQILWTEEKMAADLDRMLRARAAAAERGAGTG